MLIEFDQNTMANMTAALEYVCKKIPPDRDNHETRKRVADAIAACAKAGKRGYADFLNAGLRTLNEIGPPKRLSRFGLGWLPSIKIPWLR